MFEICETNPFDNLSKDFDQDDGKILTQKKIFIFYSRLSSFSVISLDSDDDFEVV